VLAFYHYVVILTIIKGQLIIMIHIFGVSNKFKKKVASLSNAKCSREKPLMERRYNYLGYGDYNGKKTLTP
jgi:hypothetical protein